MLYLAYCKSARIATLRFGVGSVLPMAATSIGRAWVWSLPAADRRACVTAPVAHAGREGTAVRRRLASAFTELDRFGFCLSLGDYQRDAFGLAVPLAVGLEPEKLRKNLGPEVQRAAREPTRVLADIDCTP